MDMIACFIILIAETIGKQSIRKGRRRTPVFVFRSGPF